MLTPVQRALRGPALGSLPLHHAIKYCSPKLSATHVQTVFVKILGACAQTHKLGACVLFGKSLQALCRAVAKAHSVTTLATERLLFIKKISLVRVYC
jgi:hypothetical protein